MEEKRAGVGGEKGGDEREEKSFGDGEILKGVYAAILVDCIEWEYF